MMNARLRIGVADSCGQLRPIVVALLVLCTGMVDYGDRAEHCWNGGHENPNAISQLRYNTMYVSRNIERLEAAAPPGANLRSWHF